MTYIEFQIAILLLSCSIVALLTATLFSWVKNREIYKLHREAQRHYDNFKYKEARFKKANNTMELQGTIVDIRAELELERLKNTQLLKENKDLAFTLKQLEKKL